MLEKLEVDTAEQNWEYKIKKSEVSGSNTNFTNDTIFEICPNPKDKDKPQTPKNNSRLR